MRQPFFLQRPNTLRLALVVLAVMVSLVAGALPLVWNSPLSSLLVGGIFVAAAIGIAFLQKPVWALYAVVFLSFLTEGFIPGNLYSPLTLLTLLLALLTWLSKASFQRRKIVWTSTSLLIGAFLIWSFVTLLWAPRLVDARQQLVQYTIDFILLLLIINQIDSPETLDGLMSTLALSGWVLVLAGVGTVLLLGYKSGDRLKVFDMNQNLFGTSLFIALPGVLWHVTRSSGRQKALRMVLSVVFLLLAFILVALSGSRGSALSLLVVLFAFWFWKPTRPWGKLGLLVGAVILISTPFTFSTIINRFSQEEGGALGGRDVLWKAGLLLIRDHPWGGMGIGNGTYAMPTYILSITNTDYLVLGYQTRSTHNPILDVGIDTGLVGILLYTGALASAFWLFFRQYFHFSKTGIYAFTSYFPLVLCASFAYMLSWIENGGMSSHPTYFLLLALLVIPVRFNLDGRDDTVGNNLQDVESSQR